MRSRGRIFAAGILTAVMMASSAMVSFAESGWVARGNSWYYYSPQDGTMAANRWVVTNGGKYWLNEDGTMATNRWINTNNLYYYVGPDGAAVTGWYQINGIWYYFYQANSSNAFAMAADTQIDGYRVNKDGAWVQ